MCRTSHAWFASNAVGKKKGLCALQEYNAYYTQVSVTEAKQQIALDVLSQSYALT